MVKHSGQLTGEDAAAHDDRRKHRRVDTPLKARFLNTSGDEQPCLVVNVSAGGALIKAKHPPRQNEKVVLYIDRLGRFEGSVIRSGATSFAVNYEKRRRKNAKTADALTQVVNQGKRSHDRRNNPRMLHDAPAQVVFEDGRTEECAILDISLTGASIQIAPRPPLGARLTLGRMNAKVVRRHEKGVGVVFTGQSSRMEEVIEQAAPESAMASDHGDAGAQVAVTFGKKTDNA